MSVSQSRIVGAQLNVGLTHDLLGVLDTQAQAAGISRAAFARDIIATHLQTVNPIKARRTTAQLNPADVVAISKLSADIGRLAGATIQLSKTFRSLQHPLAHREAERIVRELRIHSTAVAELMRSVER